MTKSDLIERVSEKVKNFTKRDVEIIADAIFDSMTDRLAGGEKIEIRGFGRFKVKEKKARTARNPRTNEYIDVEAGFKPVFEASKELRKRVNDAAGLTFVGEPQ